MVLHAGEQQGDGVAMVDHRCAVSYSMNHGENSMGKLKEWMEDYDILWFVSRIALIITVSVIGGAVGGMIGVMLLR